MVNAHREQVSKPKKYSITAAVYPFTCIKNAWRWHFIHLAAPPESLHFRVGRSPSSESSEIIYWP